MSRLEMDFAYEELNETREYAESLKNQVADAYDERNHVALLTALVINDMEEASGHEHSCGWCHDPEGEPGFTRFISLFHGRYTFHVPDDMNLGRLPLMKFTWDGHTTEEKYNRIRKLAEVQARHNND